MAVQAGAGEVTINIHSTAFIAPGAVVLGDVTLGPRASVWYTAVLRGDTAPIVVGEASNVQDGTVIHVDAGVRPRSALGWGSGTGSSSMAARSRMSASLAWAACS